MEYLKAIWEKILKSLKYITIKMWNFLKNIPIPFISGCTSDNAQEDDEEQNIQEQELGTNMINGQENNNPISNGVQQQSVEQNNAVALLNSLSPWQRNMISSRYQYNNNAVDTVNNAINNGYIDMEVIIRYGLSRFLSESSRILLEQQQMQKTLTDIRQKIPVIVHQQQTIMNGLSVIARDHEEIKQSNQEMKQNNQKIETILNKNNQKLDTMLEESRQMKEESRQMKEDTKQMMQYMKTLLAMKIREEKYGQQERSQQQEGDFRGMVGSQSSYNNKKI
jgi:hypothetical protein